MKTQEPSGRQMQQQVPEIDAEAFSSQLADGKPLVVDVSAEWCAPCKRYEPIFREAAQRWGGAARFVRVDADANPRLMTTYGVAGLPTTLLFRDGRLVGRVVGLATPQALDEALAKAFRG